MSHPESASECRSTLFILQRPGGLVIRPGGLVIRPGGLGLGLSWEHWSEELVVRLPCMGVRGTLYGG